MRVRVRASRLVSGGELRALGGGGRALQLHLLLQRAVLRAQRGHLLLEIAGERDLALGRLRLGARRRQLALELDHLGGEVELAVRRA